MSKSKRLAKKSGSNTSINEKIEDKSKFVFQNNKIDFQLNIRERPDLTERQKELANLILDKKTKVVFINGVAGTAKTYTTIYAALQLLNKKAISDILYVRTIVESASKSLGALPGEIGDKIEPFMLPFHDKLEEFLPSDQVTALLKQNRVHGLVVNHLRGASFNAKFIICDEAQNYTYPEMVTAITRLGEYSKIIFLGDSNQSDVNGKSGFMKMFDLFNQESSRENGIHCFSFTKDDIVRSGILKYICGVLDSVNYQKTETMFPQK